MSFFESFEFSLILVIIFLLGSTFLIKKFIKTSKTFYIFSMIKTTRFNPILEKFTFLGKFLDFMAYVGLILGFGVFGADYLFARNQKSKLKRISIIVLCFFVLYFLFQFLLSPLFASNPSTAQFSFWFPVVFGIFGLAGFTLFSLAVNAFDIILKIFLGKKACPGVAPLIPGVQIPNVPIVVPFIAWIPLFLILIIHEGFHGIQARREKIKVKSTGLLLAGLFPIGAFVEPDENQLKHKSKLAQLRVFANGATSNMFSIFAMLALALLLVPILTPMQNELISARINAVDSVIISDVSETTEFCGDTYSNSAFNNLEKGMQIRSVNSVPVHSIVEVQTQIAEVRQNNQELVLGVQSVSNELSEKKLTPNPLGRYGFSMEEKLNPGFVFSEDYFWKAAFLNAIYTIINWFVILSLLIAIVNFLPMDPFDGGKMARIIYLPYLSFLNLPPKQTEKFFQRFILWLVLVLFFLNALPLFL
ncbi:MAG: site-2 protease family protein [Candidatus Diapherotrites archaeon]|nr:site-2 protease family protein [Candidatus Diapherotrites archaeon]